MIEKKAETVPVSLEQVPDYDPKLILEQAGIDWSGVGQFNADAIAVSTDLADAWRTKLGDEEFNAIGPKVDPDLPEGTAAVYKDLVGGEGGETKQAPEQQKDEKTEGPQDEAAQGDYRVGEENAGDGEAKDMLPGASEQKRGSRASRHPRQRALARYARSAGKHGPRNYHEENPDHPREYSFTDWWSFENEVSGSGGGESLLGEPKGTDKKEKKT